jgi:predicted acylesterase/phospholipase RssA
MSCPAPEGGVAVGLQSSDPEVIAVPGSVALDVGERSVVVSFTASVSKIGRVTITASAAGHRSTSISYLVENRTALVLSGGGAKGSFQVGALKYFALERWDEVDPSIVCATSVGAINALPIAEGSGPSGIERLERTWLRLRIDKDMYDKSLEAQQVENITGTKIEDLFGGGGRRRGEIDLFDDFLAGLPIVGGFVVAEIEEKINQLMDVFRRMRSIYDLQPTKTQILREVRFEDIASSGKRLRLASVCLEDGEVYYVTEQGQLLRGHAANPSFSAPLAGSLRDNITDGAIASSAIPVVFGPVVLSGAGFSRTFVDGGVREILPMRAAVELGAQRIIAIAVSPNRLEPHVDTSGNPVRDFAGKNLFDIGSRALGLATFEIKRNEVSPDEGYCDDIERISILPTFTLHDTTTIDPGLILVNMAYGYMRAFETYKWYQEELSIGELLEMVDNTDTIIQARKRIWELENGALFEIPAPIGLPERLPGAEYLEFDRTKMAEIRRLKRSVFDSVRERFERWGAESVPKAFNDTQNGYMNTVFDWWETWERHQEPIERRLRGHDLWTALARVESNIPPKPVTPTAMRTALQS